MCHSYIQMLNINPSKILICVKIGEKVGSVGPTGSGKSTAMDIILGLLEPHLV